MLLSKVLLPYENGCQRTQMDGFSIKLHQLGAIFHNEKKKINTHIQTHFDMLGFFPVFGF